ncbi:DinB family protein [Paenibacillus taihuensis]|uniref:DinB family protein n=1 Tax=Paenibacillus taihuensis TaxID=1156355 RepID=A0A3D9R393_9BACL|nr:DinB family protein [Paenibacillus taihuensis]REE67303.1 DinB family protein [Paenibacillus taihuensis]
MNKESIINEKLSLIEWSISLRSISNELWFKSFLAGSWGTADVISHFISWDQFMIKNRIPYILKGKSFPKISVDVESINKGAINYARSGITKEELINKFISVRKELVSFIDAIPAKKFDQPFPGKEPMTLIEYFVRMVHHDLKHKEQILSFLKTEVHS